MMLTIHGLPVTAKYADLKKLIKDECNIVDFVLDNMVKDDEGPGKKLRIGLANDDEGSYLMRRLDGYRIGSHVMKVVPVGKSQQQKQLQNSYNDISNQGRSDYNQPKNDNMGCQESGLACRSWGQEEGVQWTPNTHQGPSHLSGPNHHPQQMPLQNAYPQQMAIAKDKFQGLSYQQFGQQSFGSYLGQRPSQPSPTIDQQGPPRKLPQQQFSKQGAAPFSNKPSYRDDRYPQVPPKDNRGGGLLPVPEGFSRRDDLQKVDPNARRLQERNDPFIPNDPIGWRDVLPGRNELAHNRTDPGRRDNVPPKRDDLYARGTFPGQRDDGRSAGLIRIREDLVAKGDGFAAPRDDPHKRDVPEGRRGDFRSRDEPHGWGLSPRRGSPGRRPSSGCHGSRHGRRVSPGRRWSPERRISPSRRVSPGRRVSSGCRVSPGRWVSPGRQVSPGRRLSPGRWVSPDRRTSPGRWVSFERRVSPGRWVSSGRRESPGRRISRGRWTSPPRRSPNSDPASDRRPGVFGPQDGHRASLESQALLVPVAIGHKEEATQPKRRPEQLKTKTWGGEGRGNTVKRVGLEEALTAKEAEVAIVATSLPAAVAIKRAKRQRKLQARALRRKQKELQEKRLQAVSELNDSGAVALPGLTSLITTAKVTNSSAIAIGGRGLGAAGKANSNQLSLTENSVVVTHGELHTHPHTVTYAPIQPDNNITQTSINIQISAQTDSHKTKIGNTRSQKRKRSSGATSLRTAVAAKKVRMSRGFGGAVVASGGVEEDEPEGHASAATAHLRVIVLQSDHLDIDETRACILRRKLESLSFERFLKQRGDKSLLMPLFKLFPRLASGGLRIHCEDEWSLDWLKSQVEQMKGLWEGCPGYYLIQESLMKRYTRGVIWVPDFNEGDAGVLKNYLAVMNKANYDLSKWSLVHSKVEKVGWTHNFTLIVGIPLADLQKLKDTGCRLFYKFATVYVRIRGLKNDQVRVTALEE